LILQWTADNFAVEQATLENDALVNKMSDDTGEDAQKIANHRISSHDTSNLTVSDEFPSCLL